MRVLVVLAVLAVLLSVNAVQAERWGLCPATTQGGAVLVVEKVNARGQIVCKYELGPDDWRRPGN